MVKVTLMGEPVSLDELPTGVTNKEPMELGDHFRPVKLSPLAINQASKVVPIECWHNEGLYKWLQGRANYVFKHLPANKMEGNLGVLKYVYEFDYEGPVLKTVFLG